MGYIYSTINNSAQYQSGKVNNVEVVMELDKGASLIIMSEKALQLELPHRESQQSAVSYAYTKIIY